VDALERLHHIELKALSLGNMTGQLLNLQFENGLFYSDLSLFRINATPFGYEEYGSSETLHFNLPFSFVIVPNLAQNPHYV
tara:strand:- start:1173 stop:1415 length:243 start_codon:yes stop_codon:yes gene_type:complete